MDFIQHFIVEGKLLGSAVIKPYFYDGILKAPFPHCLVCQYCADVWARFPIEGGDKPFIVRTGLCRKHGHHFETVVSGSLTLLGAPEWQNYWPDGALQWELERELDFYERWHKV